MSWRCFVGRGSGRTSWILGARSEETYVHAPKDNPYISGPSDGSFGGRWLAASVRLIGEAPRQRIAELGWRVSGVWVSRPFVGSGPATLGWGR